MVCTLYKENNNFHSRNLKITLIVLLMMIVVVLLITLHIYTFGRECVICDFIDNIKKLRLKGIIVFGKTNVLPNKRFEIKDEKEEV